MRKVIRKATNSRLKRLVKNVDALCGQTMDCTGDIIARFMVKYLINSRKDEEKVRALYGISSLLRCRRDATGGSSWGYLDGNSCKKLGEKKEVEETNVSPPHWTRAFGAY